METVAAVFAGAVFGGFGAALLVWTGTRVRAGRPAAAGGGGALAALYALLGAVCLSVGAWCLAQL